MASDMTLGIPASTVSLTTADTNERRWGGDGTTMTLGIPASAAVFTTAETDKKECFQNLHKAIQLRSSITNTVTAQTVT